MNKFYLIGCLFLSAYYVSAQDSTIHYERNAGVILKLAPLWLIDADPTLSGGLEIRTGKRTSIQGEFGYGWPDWNNPGLLNRHAGTWRIQTEMRFYTGRYRTNRKRNIRVSSTYPIGNYFAISAYAKLLNINHTWYYQDANTAVQNLPDDIRHSLIRRNSMSLGAKFGRQVGWNNNAHQKSTRLLLDVYAGAGLRVLYQYNEDWEAPGYMNFSGMFNRFNSNGYAIVPTVNLGLKLGFAL